MAIRLYDSLTRDYKVLGQRETGVPPVSKEHPFTFYNCGPTVYGPAHIGNFRTFVVNDVLRRLLILEFGADQVRYVRNFTDVDDKTIRRAREEGRPLAEVTKQWTDKFHADCAALNCLPLDPQFEPTATGHIANQRRMIEVLMQKGHAYRTSDGSVYFKVASFSGYGELSRLKERELQPGAALLGKPQSADADEKEDGSDFALWKAWKPEDGPVKWPGPAGAAAGRPGWHIECSAMAKEHLGETIDLHSGGVDLLFPHHENEIAQSECCNGVQFSRHWYHSEHLLVDGKKMSKSLGNLYTLDDLEKKIMQATFNPLAVRFALIHGHPRKQLNFVTDSLFAAVEALSKLAIKYDVLKTWAKAPDSKPRSRSRRSDRFNGVIAALQNDLNFPEALGVLFEMGRQEESGDPAGDLLAFERAIYALGLKLKSHISLDDDYLASGVAEVPCEPAAIAAPAGVISLAEKRKTAKLAKDFSTADALRKEIAAAGWNLKDGKEGAYTLEPVKR